MEFVSNYKPRKSCLKSRQSDKRAWDGDDDGADTRNLEADLFEQATIYYFNSKIQENTVSNFLPYLSFSTGDFCHKLERVNLLFSNQGCTTQHLSNLLAYKI